ncbi:MAG: rhomboid family intramembrane serine protease [Phycisphaeraceae bacterium]
MARWPLANFAIIIGTVYFSFMVFAAGELPDAMVLNDWSPSSLFGSALLHGDIIHLAGNMLFLWVFGNAVCAKMGNVLYALAYAGLAGAASVVHLLLDGDPAIGASGAINGVIGVALIWYPANSVSCFWFFFVRGGTFDLDCRFLVAIWLAFDLFGAMTGGGGIAYWAHLGGLGAGAGVGVMMLKYHWIEMTDTEHSIFEVYGKPAKRTERKKPVGVGPVPNWDPSGVAPLSTPYEEPAVAEKATAAVETATATVEAMKVRCRCGAGFRVKSAHRGKKGRCPKCGEVVKLQPAE